MANFVVGSFAFNMTTWDLSDIAGGTVTSDTATQVNVTGDSGAFVYTVTGTGFTTFDTNGFPTDGTVTGMTMSVPGKTPVTIHGISISATDFMGFVNSNDATGLETAIFSGNDGFTGRAGNDTLLGFGGADSFNLTKGGNDTVDGGSGNDTFNFGGALTAADSVNGGTGSDKVELNGDYSAGVTFGAATMTSVEAMVLVKGHNYVLDFNAASDTSGQSLNVTGGTLTAANHVDLDASALAGNIRLVGGAGDDTLKGSAGASGLVGGNGNDQIFAGTGLNNISAGAGNDTITITNFTAGSFFNGGGDIGGDTLVLNGDFSVGLTLDSSDIKGIFKFTLDAGHTYDLTIDTSRFAQPGNALETFTLDGSALTDNLTVNWKPGFQNLAVITGGSGDDTINLDMTGITSATSKYPIDMSQGGDDTVIISNFPNNGLTVANISYGAAFTSADVFQHASISLDGDYSAGVTLNASDILDGGITVAAGHDYNITTGNVAPDGFPITINAFALGTGDTFIYDGTGTEEKQTITSSAGHTTIMGGENGNTIFVTGLGATSVVVDAGAAADVINVTNISSAVAIDGQGGNDVVSLSDTTSGTLNLSSGMFTSVETLRVGVTHVVVTSNIVAPGQTMFIQPLAGGQNFDGSAETTGAFNFTGAGTGGNLFEGGAGNDVVDGGHSNNFITGNGGGDLITCNVDVDKLIYHAVTDSTSTGYDILIAFDPAKDLFDMPFTVTGVDAQVTTGTLSTTSFDTDLAAAIGAGQLAAHHAVLFTPNAGNIPAGNHFLVIDANGIAGYQAGQDYVIDVANPFSTTLTTANFV